MEKVKEMKFKDLTVEHDYFCAPLNYTDNTADQTWKTWTDFYEEYKGRNINIDLIFRWDIHEIGEEYRKEGQGKYHMDVFIMQQLRGHFIPHHIQRVDEKDFETIKELLSGHYQKLQRIWAPFSQIN